MKKRMKLIVGVFLISNLLCACSSKKTIESYEPRLEQIKHICELSTLECYYHNVAKARKDGRWVKADRIFWIEYTGIARIGIDMSEVKMEISGDEVKIYVPEAKLLNIEVKEDTFNADSYIIDEDSGFFDNKITADDQTSAIADAQKNMKDTVESNKILFANARERAKMLIENYIEQIGEACDKEYIITFIEINDINSEVSSESEEVEEQS